MLPSAPSTSVMLLSVASSLKSPIITTLVAGLIASTESAAWRMISAARSRLGAEASLPPRREGQWATMK